MMYDYGAMLIGILLFTAPWYVFIGLYYLDRWLAKRNGRR